MPATKKFLAPAEVAAILEVSPITLRIWRHRKRRGLSGGFGPRALKIGGCVRYRKKDVQRWLKRCAEAE